jgi:hypothetical protein
MNENMKTLSIKLGEGYVWVTPLKHKQYPKSDRNKKGQFVKKEKNG